MLQNAWLNATKRAVECTKRGGKYIFCACWWCKI